MPTVSTNAELLAALSVAVGGETIELVGGNYGSLFIIGLAFPSDVMIVSADPANPAVVSDLNVTDSSHLVFDGIFFEVVADFGQLKPFAITNSANITIRNSVFDGDEVLSGSGSGEKYGYGYGLHILDSDLVVAEYNEFFNFGRGLVVKRATNVTVRGNDLHSLSSDGMDFVSVDGLLVEGNWIHDFKLDPTAGAHPDMIQFWIVASETSARNVIIRNNFLDDGIGDRTQAIFMGNGLKGGTFEQYAYRNFLIENNVIYVDHVHGISLGEFDGLVIRNNTLLLDPHTLTPLNWGPQIRLNATSLNVTLENNITSDVYNWYTRYGTDQPDWIVGNNLLLDYNPASSNYYSNLFVNVLAVDATLADLRAVEGGVIETDIVGAEMTRANILMVVGPYATASVPEPGVCEVLLAEALTVVADLEALLTFTQAEIITLAQTNETQAATIIATLTALASAEGERDAAVALQAIAETERDVALASLASMTALWGEAVNALVVAETVLVNMTVERDTALSALAAVETQLAVALAKIDAARLALA